MLTFNKKRFIKSGTKVVPKEINLDKL